MKGSKYTDEQREQALAMLASGMTVTRTAAAMKIPKQTISNWSAKASETDEDFVAARNEEKRKIVKQSWKIVDQAVQAVGKQVGASLREKRDIDRVITTILKSGAVDEVTTEQICKIVREYSGTSMTELTRAMTAVYTQQQSIAAELEGGTGGQEIQIAFDAAEEFAV